MEDEIMEKRDKVTYNMYDSFVEDSTCNDIRYYWHSSSNEVLIISSAVTDYFSTSRLLEIREERIMALCSYCYVA